MPKKSKGLTTVRHMLPDYIQLGLDGRELSCVEAIEECIKTFSKRCIAEIAAIGICGTHARRLEADLRQLGFKSKALSPTERAWFSQVRHSLFAAVGSLSGVRRLADIYFPGASVQRGRPYPRTRLSSQRTLRLSDREESRRVISVHVRESYSGERTAEFLVNCRRLIPLNVQVEIKTQIPRSPARDTTLRFNHAMKEGRLSCRTLPN